MTCHFVIGSEDYIGSNFAPSSAKRVRDIILYLPLDACLQLSNKVDLHKKGANHEVNKAQAAGFKAAAIVYEK